jgi:hypothetical protein
VAVRGAGHGGAGVAAMTGADPDHQLPAFPGPADGTVVEPAAPVPVSSRQRS